MLLAQQDARPLVEFTLAPLLQEHGIPLAIMGIFVVFMALTLIVVFITCLPHVLARVSTTKIKPPADMPMAFDETVPEEVLVVIAAAVAVSIGTPHRIVKVRGLTPSELGWSLEGRMQHHQSHQLRGRNRC